MFSWFPLFRNLKMPLNYSTSIVMDKGLSNYFGHNNCFLNSAVQVFWHLQVFRKNFLAMRNHDCVEGSCIYCALQDIFREFKESDENTLNPDMLRLTLACSFQDQDKFQLGQLDDAAECYEKILSRIHFHLSGGASDDFCSLGHCITHVKFAMSLIQQTLCQCSATSEPLPYVQLVDYVSTLSIIECSKMMKTNDFSELLRYAFNYEMSSTCPLKCGLKSRTVRTLVNCPDVVSIGLIWNSDQPDPDHIREFVSTIGEHVTLHKLFDGATGFNTTESSVRELVGVVCYYFKHYSTFFKRSKDGRWISFDDASVSEIGDTWDKVIDKCCKGKYQPLLLIYQNKQAELINTKTAPKKTSFIVKSFECSQLGMKSSRLRSGDKCSTDYNEVDKVASKTKIIGKERKYVEKLIDSAADNKTMNSQLLYSNYNAITSADRMNFLSSDLDLSIGDLRSSDGLPPYYMNSSYGGLNSSLLPASTLAVGTSHSKDTKGLINQVDAKIANDRRNRLLKIQQNQKQQRILPQFQQQPHNQYCMEEKYQQPSSQQFHHNYSIDTETQTMNNPVYPAPLLSSHRYIGDYSNEAGNHHSYTLPQQNQHSQYNPQPYQPDHRHHSKLTSFQNQSNIDESFQYKFSEPPNNASFLKKITENLGSDHYNSNNRFDNNFSTFPFTKSSSKNVSVESSHTRRPTTEGWSRQNYLNDNLCSAFDNLNMSTSVDSNNDYINFQRDASLRESHLKNTNTSNNHTHNNNNSSYNANSSRSIASSLGSSYENISSDKDFVVLSREELSDSKNLMEFTDDNRNKLNEKIRALYKS